MTTLFTASHAIQNLKLKGKISSATSLNDNDILSLLNDSYFQYIIGFTQSLRDEWWVGQKALLVTADADSTIALPPGSVGSSIRTIAWNQGSNQITPLNRIEPENAFPYLSQGPTGSPMGFMFNDNVITILPPSPGVSIRLTYMLSPPEMVLEQNAAKVNTVASTVLTLASVPLQWQATAPTQVNIISASDPYTVLGVLPVVSLNVSTKTLTLGVAPTTLSHYSELSLNGIWVANVGESPFPMLPRELQELLQQHTLETIMGGMTGDPRLKAVTDRKNQMASELKHSMSPRAQGSSRPLINKNRAGYNGNPGRSAFARKR